MTAPMPPQRPALARAGSATTDPSASPALKGHAGSTTSDAVRAVRLVRLQVDVPKHLRRALRAEAKRRGISVSELVAVLLRDRV